MSVVCVCVCVCVCVRVSVASPEAVVEPAALRANVGCQVTLTCLEGAGAPLQGFQWRLDDVPLQATSRVVIRSNGQLLISDLQVEDSGSYACTVFGEFENATAVGVLTVEDPLFPAPPPPYPPSITSPTPNSQLLPPGQLAQFVCLVDGSPPPEVTWLMNGEEVDTMENDSRVEVIQSRVLVVSNVTANDSGVYTCHASNSEGNTTRDFTLAITGTERS